MKITFFKTFNKGEIMYKKLLLFPLLLLSGCSTVDSEWVKNQEGNHLKVSSGRSGERRFVQVHNTMKTWNGKYQGDKALIPERKEFLGSVAKEEAARICGGPQAYVSNDDPSFVMQDSSGSKYGGGLLGEIIADIATSDENIPVSIYYRFKCMDETNLAELSKRG
jgi:hypothetical protein